MLFVQGEPDPLVRRYYLHTSVLAQTLTIGVVGFFMFGVNISVAAIVIGLMFHALWLVALIATGHSARITISQTLVTGIVALIFCGAVLSRSELITDHRGTNIREFIKLATGFIAVTAFFPVVLVAGVSGLAGRRSRVAKPDC